LRIEGDKEVDRQRGPPRARPMQFRMRQMCLFAVVLGEEPQRLQQLMPE
jgi:hypothetical protein